MSILLPMAVGMFVLAEEIMWLYTKDVYTYAYSVLGLAALSRIIYGYESIATNLLMYACGFEKNLSIFLLGGGVLNLLSNIILVYTGTFSAFSSLLTTVCACAIVTILCKKYFEKKMNMKCNFFSKDIIGYLMVSLTFIPIAVMVKLLKLNYWLNIGIIVTACVLVYGIFLLLKKDPLVSVVLDKISRK